MIINASYVNLTSCFGNDFYISTKTELESAEVFEKTNKDLEAKIDQIISELQLN